MLLLILMLVLLVALVGGGFGHSRYGYVGWSPAAVLVVIGGFLLFTGHLHL